MTEWPHGRGEMARRIRAYDWAATPLGPIERWSPIQKAIVDLMLASGHAMQLAWGSERTILYNDAYAPMLGARHPSALGMAFRDAWPDIWNDIEPLVERVFVGETVRFEDMPLAMTRNGYTEATWWNFSYSPVRDESGAVTGLLNVTVDVTSLHRAQQAEHERDAVNARLQENEARFRALVTAGANSIYRMSPDWRLMYALDSQTLANTTGPIENWVDKYIPDEDRARVFAAIDEAIRTRSVFELEHRVLLNDGRIGWVLSRAVPLLGPGGDVIEWFGAGSDVTERRESVERLHQSEAASSERQKHQAFLLKLGDALRAEPDAESIGRTATHLVGEYLGVDRSYICHLSRDGEWAFIEHESRRPGLFSIEGSYDLRTFPNVTRQLLSRSLFYPDAPNDPTLTALDKQSIAAMGMTAVMAAVLARGEGNFIWTMAVGMTRPRAWTVEELRLLQEAAERVWTAIQRVRAEAAQRESEQRFRQFAEASAAALWIRDASTLTMEYVSRAISPIYGVEQDAFLGDMKRWAALIVPEDRDHALENIERARRGEAVVHEFRIQRSSDQAFRWIRNTDFPLRDRQGRVQRIGGIAEDVTETKLAREHQGVLLAELKHRVRNIMAVIRSIASRTADGAQDVGEYQSRLEGRLLALARVQNLLTREANAGGSLRSILESEVGAQAPLGARCEFVGPDIRLSPKAVEVLTLAVHELATNALKYGALSVPQGRLSVKWTPFEKQGRAWLALEWIEEGAPPRAPATRRGFGSELIERRIPYELAGTGKITLDARGARCRLEFPLKDHESILETDAPRATTIFGGTLDMAGAPDLTGRRVLVVEDDYYLASDTVAALRGAGARVLGPCPSQGAVLDLLEAERPTHAVVDLNLGGGGPRFEIAQVLKARGVPFVFLTGYDPESIPTELKDVVRLRKPIPFRELVEAVDAL